MSMYLGWLRCFMWVVFIRTSFQYEGPDGNYSVIANSSAKLNNSGIPDFSVRPYPNNCACHDHLGKIYNLQPLQSTDGNASFTVHGKKYPGYRYSYSPCSSFELGPLDGGCRWDVAVCRWVPKGSPDTYKTIGNQGKARCQLDKKTKIPILMYKSSDFPYRKAKIQLKCDERKKDKDEAIFEILDDTGQDWIFQLTHLCACGDGCRIYPDEPTTTEYIATTSPDPFDPKSIGIPIAVSAGTVVILLVPFLVWLVVKNRNNDEQRRNLLDNDAGDQQRINNPIRGRSQPMPIGSSRNKADVNVTSARV
ncbi:hypothetical protein OS493_000744 [Desmophyllum pertusum]|uniref:Uncharacterized protein n=1 Tax=Desmophyllum pertusum TaxID=174260 RepID=A0A9X0A7R5_9CNID|nr:hypothetical protein OS493_000744 [Desmophyllum pertusum]